METVMGRVGPLRWRSLFLAVVLLPAVAWGEQTAREVLKEQRDHRLWKEVGGCPGAERYLKAFPEGLHADEARECLAAEQVERQVERLLEECDAHLAAGRLSTAARGGNAVDCYGEVLSLDRGSREALSGLDRVMEEYGRRVRKALEGGRLERARGFLEKMAELNAESLEVMDLEDAIARAERDAAERKRAEAERERKAKEAEARRRAEAERKAKEAEERRRAEARKRQPGYMFRDCPGCPEMVVVREGRFRMGSTAGIDDERPVHEVTIARPFAVGVHEVTRGEFARFVSATGRSMGNRCRTYEDEDWEWRDGRHWKSPGFRQTDSHPVVCVYWDDAQAYVRWLSRKTGKAYRLPSESEWEYVARAGTTGPYHFGSSLSSSQANYGNNRGGTAPVGSYPANAFGLHDVHGNVWEWVEDCWNDSYNGAPSNGSAWESGRCEVRVLRGGSWDLEPGYLRSANRGWFTAGDRVINNGFRVARTLTP